MGRLSFSKALRVPVAIALAGCLAGAAAPQERSATHPNAVALDALLAEQLAADEAAKPDQGEEEYAVSATVTVEVTEEDIEGEIADEAAEDVALAMADLADAMEGEADAMVVVEEDVSPEAETADAIAEFVADAPRGWLDSVPEVRLFEQQLADALREEADIAAAVRALAPEYGLGEAAMARFARAYVLRKFHEYDFRGGRDRAQAELVASVADLGFASFAVTAAASLIDDDACNQAVFDGLSAAAPDRQRAAWDVVRGEPCPENLARFIDLAPARAAAALVEFVDARSDEVGPALSQWMLGDALLSQVAPRDRDHVATRLERGHLERLLEAGLAAEAIDFLDALEPGRRAAVLAPDERKRIVEVAGLPVSLGAQTTGSLQAELAAALLVTDNVSRARAFLAKAPDYEEVKAAYLCVQSLRDTRARRDECGVDYGTDFELMLIDHALDRPDEDPYPLAELIWGYGASSTPSASYAGVTCRLFAAARFGPICGELRARAYDKMEFDENDYAWERNQSFHRAVAALELDGLDALARRYDALATAMRAELGDADIVRWSARETIDPVVPAFIEHKLPAGVPAARLSSDYDEIQFPAAFGDLPGMFMPVRWEVSGDTVVAISVSPLFDRTGEISLGGYWVHLSRDGGKSWAETLYTGLAEHFPYVVPRSSQLPMLQEDRLTLEVAVRQIDTASITYPPVGLQTAREADGLYLEIPLAQLRADGDGDGWSDLAEAHLLLDRAGADRPYVVGEDRASVECLAVPDRATLARIELLDAIFEVKSTPIVEPLAAGSGNPLAFGNWRKTPDQAPAPLFLRGDADDYRCLDIDAPVIVYTDAQVAELQRRSPDFRTIALPAMITNAAGDRGYVEWSAGWTGGTLLFEWDGEKWDVSTISSWIT